MRTAMLDPLGITLAHDFQKTWQLTNGTTAIQNVEHLEDPFTLIYLMGLQTYRDSDER